MRADYTGLLDRFPDLRVLVIGEAMLDRYLRGTADRICAEAPVPIVSLSSVTDALGGAANVAANVASLGARVTFASLVGDDAEGRSLLERLAAFGIEGDGIQVERGRRTLAKQRVLSGSQILLRLDQGDTGHASPDAESAIAAALERAVDKADAVIVSDYAYGVMTPRVVGDLTQLVAGGRTPVFVDAKDLPQYRSLQPYCVKPNYLETVRLLGQPSLGRVPDRIRQVEALAGSLLDATGAGMATVTLDVDGAVVLNRDETPYIAHVRSLPAAHGAGAGDSFLAAFALASAAGATGAVAADVAVAAAAEAVCREETAVCSRAGLWAQLYRGATPRGNTSELVASVMEERRRGRRIVFTNGCFDIVHSGHASFLRAARDLGDVLVVGLNSDESVARLKGPSRPVNCLDARYSVLTELESVDYVIPFEQDTPEELIHLLRPDVYCKGGDYRRDDLPEAPLVESLGGTVRILDYLEDYSTTGIIERISQTGGSHA